MIERPQGSFFRVNEQCNGCLACVQNCPGSALDFRDEEAPDRRTLLHNMTRCARCATCWRVCPQDAIEFQHLLENRWDEVVTLPLVRCRVCGEAVHTDLLAKAVTERAGEGVAERLEPLCDLHRRERGGRAQAARLLGKKALEGGAG